jgi:hypothetical protein
VRGKVSIAAHCLRNTAWRFEPQKSFRSKTQAIVDKFQREAYIDQPVGKYKIEARFKATFSL